MADSTADTFEIVDTHLLERLKLKIKYLGAGLHARVVALAGGESHVGSVGGTTLQLALPALTVQAALYTTLRVVDTKHELAGAFRTGGPGTGLLQSIFLMELGTQKPALEILIFNAEPVSGVYTDNVAFPNNAADMAKLIRKIAIPASAWVTVGNYSIVDLLLGGKPISATTGTSLWFVITLGGTSTPTFGSTTALSGRIGILQD